MDRPSHLDDETLARLVDGALAPAGTAEARRHLARCPRCVDRYAELIEVRLSHGLGHAAPAAFVAPAGPSANRRGWRSRFATAGACAAALLALVLAWGRDGGAPSGPDAALRAPIEQALGRRSATGLLYPGIAPRPATAYRAGGSADGLDRSLDALGDAYVSRPGDCATAWWLAAGHLCAGHPENVRLVLDQVEARCGASLSFRLLQADLALLLEDPDRAARVLESETGSDHARLGLALARRDQGRAGTARRILEDLARGAEAPAVRERARHELRRLRAAPPRS